MALRKFTRRWFLLYIAGATIQEIKSVIEDKVGKWKADGAAGKSPGFTKDALEKAVKLRKINTWERDRMLEWQDRESLSAKQEDIRKEIERKLTGGVAK